MGGGVAGIVGVSVVIIPPVTKDDNSITSKFELACLIDSFRLYSKARRYFLSCIQWTTQGTYYALTMELDTETAHLMEINFEKGQLNHDYHATTEFSLIQIPEMRPLLYFEKSQIMPSSEMRPPLYSGHFKSSQG